MPYIAMIVHIQFLYYRRIKWCLSEVAKNSYLVSLKTTYVYVFNFSINKSNTNHPQILEYMHFMKWFEDFFLNYMPSTSSG